MLTASSQVQRVCCLAETGTVAKDRPRSRTSPGCCLAMIPLKRLRVSKGAEGKAAATVGSVRELHGMEPGAMVDQIGVLILRRLAWPKERSSFHVTLERGGFVVKCQSELGCLDVSVARSSIFDHFICLANSSNSNTSPCPGGWKHLSDWRRACAGVAPRLNVAPFSYVCVLSWLGWLSCGTKG